MIFDLMSEASGGGNDNKILGVMVAIVTNNKDPQKLGRVKLNLPVREQDNQTDWVRIATLMGGKNMGSLFIPEVGDEVLVAFNQGEIQEPFVIGSLWNDKNPPPKPNDKNNIRQITSREGHEITFDDDKKGSILIKTKKGKKIFLDEKSDTIKIEKDGGNSIVITKSNITAKSGQSEITMKNSGDIILKSAKAITIDSAQIKMSAKATLDLKAAAINVKASGPLILKGAVVKIN